MYRLYEFEGRVVGAFKEEDNIRTSFLFLDPPCREYIEYQGWLAEGNEPLPPFPPVIGEIGDLTTAKGVATAHVRSTAFTKLQPTDWVVVREMESRVSAPAEITAYRTAVRAAADEKVATIEGKQKLETLATYLRSPEFAAWPDAPSA